jgi:hypothetical protein
MLRIMYILGISALTLAGTLLVLSALDRSRQDPNGEQIAGHPNAIQQFRAHVSGSGIRSAEDSPLVTQAKALALYLNPAEDPEKPSSPMMTVGGAPAALVVRPAAPSVRFKLCGTSYYPNEPGRSMALISELGSLEGNERWVKEGTQIGHFVIHEIRKGMIVYRDGEQLREMAVEHGASVPSLVRDTRPGSRQVSRAADDIAAVVASPAGPNDVGLVGGN